MKEKKKNDSFLVVFVLLLAGFWLILKPPGNNGATTQSSTGGVVDVVESTVSADLKNTHQNLAIKKREAELAKTRLSKITENDKIRKQVVYEPGLKLRGVNHEQRVARELEDIEKSPVIYQTSPEEKIASIVERDRWIAEYEEARDREYVEAFLDRAKKAGIEVELNDNLEIIGIREKKEPEALRFPQSTNSQGGGIK